MLSSSIMYSSLVTATAPPVVTPNPQSDQPVLLCLSTDWDPTAVTLRCNPSD